MDPTGPGARAQERRNRSRGREAGRRGNRSGLRGRVRRIGARPEGGRVTAGAALGEARLGRRCPPHSGERVQVGVLDTAIHAVREHLRLAEVTSLVPVTAAAGDRRPQPPNP